MHAPVRRTITRDWVTLKASLQWQHEEEERKRHTFRCKHTQITEELRPFEFQDGADRQGGIYFLSWAHLCLLLKVREQLFKDKQCIRKKKSPEKSKCPTAAMFPALQLQRSSSCCNFPPGLCHTFKCPQQKHRKAGIKEKQKQNSKYFHTPQTQGIQILTIAVLNNKCPSFIDYIKDLITSKMRLLHKVQWDAHSPLRALGDGEHVSSVSL